MDNFSFFFGFYGLILGLATAELLTGFAGLARRFRIREIDKRLLFLGLYVFLDICSIWIDAFQTLKNTQLRFEDLAAPILIATFLFLAAAMAFPRDKNELSDVATYFDRRKGFIAAMLISAEVAITVTFRPLYESNLTSRPMVFWLWNVPYKLAILGSIAALFFVSKRRSAMVAISIMIAVLAVPYWQNEGFPRWIHTQFDAPAPPG